MNQNVLFTLLFSGLCINANCQSQDSTFSSTLSNPRTVTVVTTDSRTYKGMVADITTDYIILDLKKNNTVMVNTPYYLRPVGKYYRIDVQYIQVLSTKKRKGVLNAAIVGGLGGMLALGTSEYINQNNNGDGGKDFSNFLGASALGFVVGSSVSAITALVVHKKWPVNGSSERLAAFRDHYF